MQRSAMHSLAEPFRSHAFSSLGKARLREAKREHVDRETEFASIRNACGLAALLASARQGSFNDGPL